MFHLTSGYVAGDLITFVLDQVFLAVIVMSLLKLIVGSH